MSNPAVWQISHWELTMRILFALVVGGLIGLEREYGQHSAGFRTHILVCLGSALIMLLSIYGFSAFVGEANVRADPARLAAQVISGIGFLGAGTILRNGNSISGLTTAASLWVVAALGLAIGAGFYYGALLTAFLVLVCLFVLNKLEKSFSGKRRMAEVTVVLQETGGIIRHVMGIMSPLGASVTGVSSDTDAGIPGGPILQLQLKVKNMMLEKHPEIIGELRLIPGVQQVNYQLADSKSRRKPSEDPLSGEE
ncbi:MgtC/SapB family protein [Cohnella caldifontis]|uniref:MgtC/SapB family protein n=1 Tax=Cohnella caldifontis TaxID=3027471 RepID=UPI0023EC19A2|nr:MgtC/SapB family protein [Cohnella sp. YIM B05605]